MSKLLLTKVIFGGMIIAGGSTTGVYFGTKENIEQHLLKTTENLRKVSSDEEWMENFKKISSEVAEVEKVDPKSKTFQNLKSNITKETLQSKCESKLKENYSTMWIKNNIEEHLLEDLRNYCFKHG